MYIHVPNHHGHIYRDQNHTSVTEVESQNALECVCVHQISMLFWKRTHMQYNVHTMTLRAIQVENYGVEEARHT